MAKQNEVEGAIAYLFLLYCRGIKHPFRVKANGSTSYTEDLVELSVFRGKYPKEFETWRAKRLIGLDND